MRGGRDVQTRQPLEDHPEAALSLCSSRRDRQLSLHLGSEEEQSFLFKEGKGLGSQAHRKHPLPYQKDPPRLQGEMCPSGVILQPVRAERLGSARFGGKHTALPQDRLV